MINQYITTLILLQEEEEQQGVAEVTGEDDFSLLGHTGAMERILNLVPMLQSTSNLTNSLSAALLKVRARGIKVVGDGGDGGQDSS